MKDQLQIFENKEFGQIRVVEIDGQPWFIGKDVAAVLAYSNSRKAIADHVDTEDKGVTKCDTLGGVQKLNVINESGLYSLILSSKLPNAKKFKRWVTSEVLPSIRKHGAYMTDKLLTELLHDEKTISRLLKNLVDERVERVSQQEENDCLLEYIGAIAPKARYCDSILQCDTAIPISIIAKDYGMTAIAFNRLLHSLKIQYKMGGTWLLYSDYAGKDYTISRTYHISDTASVTHTYWSQKGRYFIYEMLKYYGILPEVEKRYGCGILH